MKVYEFGEKNAPVILLLPGTACHWKMNFGEVIPLLQTHLHVAAVSYDGFDETEDTVFPDMVKETEKLEMYMKEHFGGRVFAVYGCSLGGSFVSHMIRRGNVHIDHAIIGSSDLDQENNRIKAWFKSQVAAGMMYTLAKKGTMPKTIAQRIETAPEDVRDYMNKLFATYTDGGKPRSYLRRKSILNQYYSDLVTDVGEEISAPGTAIHVFRASKMSEIYLDRYKETFKDPDIIEFDMQHEELLLCYPERWAREVLRVCGISLPEPEAERSLFDGDAEKLPE